MRLFLALLCISASVQCHAAERLVLLTATPGGSFAAFGAALKDALAETDPSLQIELRATRGSAENLPLLLAGEADIGMVEGTLLHEQSGNGARLPVLSAMFPSPGMFAVRGDSPLARVDDLRDRKVVFGASGSGFVVLARYVLDGLGLDMHRDFDAVLLGSAKEGPPLVLSGEAAALWGGGLGWPAFEALARGPLGARFVGLSGEEIARVRARHPFLQAMQVPAHSYPGMQVPISTVGSWSWLLTRTDLPESTAHRFARALHRAQAALSRRFPAAEASAGASLAAMPSGSVLHPGVERYYRESGFLP